jgi:hypothetical protein
VPFLFLIQEQWRNYRPGKIETDLIVVPATRMWLSDCNQCCFCVSKYLLYVALSWQRNVAVFAFVFERDRLIHESVGFVVLVGTYFELSSTCRYSAVLTQENELDKCVTLEVYEHSKVFNPC